MTDSYVCGICKVTKTYEEDFPALSRKDNKTHLCSPCGQNEAMAEYEAQLKSGVWN
jgi:hypothetical protein